MNARSPLLRAPIDHARSVEVRSTWDAVFLPPARSVLENALAEHIATRRWYRTKTRTIKSARILSAPKLPLALARARIAVVELALDDGQRDHYVIPLAFVHGNALEELGPSIAVSAVMRVDIHGERPGDARRGVVVDALACESFRDELLATFRAGACVRDGNAELRFHVVRPLPPCDVEAKLNAREQTNSTIFYGDRFVAKVVRKLDPGESPDVELGRVLTEVGFVHTPALHGFVSLTLDNHPPATVGLLHERAPNEGDAWDHVIGELDRFFGDTASPATKGEAAAALIADAEALRESTTRDVGEPSRHPVPSVRSFETPSADLLDLADGGIAIGAIREVGPYAELARLLGRRIGEMHRALATAHRAAFTPEPLDTATRVTLARNLTAQFERILDLIAERDVLLTSDAKRDARRLFAMASNVKAQIARITTLADPGSVIRVHGDLHLGQVLFTGDDFAFIDFEGEPARPLEERRAKRSPMVDVAGMLRSFHYATASALRSRPDAEREALHARARLFREVVSTMLVRGWRTAIEGSDIVPSDPTALETLLEFFLLEKCIYEIRYELDNRPRWVDIPLEGLVELARSSRPSRARSTLRRGPIRDRRAPFDRPSRPGIAKREDRHG